MAAAEADSIAVQIVTLLDRVRARLISDGILIEGSDRDAG